MRWAISTGLRKGFHPTTPSSRSFPRRHGVSGRLASIVNGNRAVFTTAVSVLVWDGTAFHVYPMPGARRLVEMKADGGSLLSSADRALVARCRRPAPVHFVTGTKERCDVWIERDAKGWLVCTADGLRRFDDGHVFEIAPEAGDSSGKNVLTSVCSQPARGPLCRDIVRGIAVIGSSGAIERVISIEEGLPSRGIFSIFFSDDGALWATSAVGISRVSLGQEPACLTRSRAGRKNLLQRGSTGIRNPCGHAGGDLRAAHRAL